MAFISDVKNDIDFYKGLANLLKVLKGIAISQFYAFEKKIHTFEDFSAAVEEFLGRMDLKNTTHPLINPMSNILGVVAVTSDTGLLGGLNVQVINAAFRELSKQKGVFIVVGERGKVYARERGISCVYMEGIKEEYLYSQAAALRNYLIKEVLKGTFGTVKIIYPHAYSLVSQKIEEVTLFPYTSSIEYSKRMDMGDFVWESYSERVIEYLIYLWSVKEIYDILSWSRLAEFAARFMHLEDSTHKIDELDEKLKYKYFRLRHELTDRSMRELFAARMIFDRKGKR